MRFYYSILPFDCFLFISFLFYFIVSEFFIPFSWVGRTYSPYLYLFLFLCPLFYPFWYHQILVWYICQVLWLFGRESLDPFVAHKSKSSQFQLQGLYRFLFFFSLFSLYSFSGNTLYDIIDSWRTLHEKLTFTRISFGILKPLLKGSNAFSKMAEICFFNECHFCADADAVVINWL